MFRKFLATTNNHLFQLNWVKKVEGVIRVVVFDDNTSKAFVVVYFEQKNQYSIIAFDTNNGNFFWAKNVIHGGYGTPAIIDDVVICHTKFTNIIALDKNCGSEKWVVETNYRIRSAINVFDNKIYFSAGKTIFEVGAAGQILSQWNHEGAFFYGPVDVFDELILSLGTIEDENEESVIKVFAFHRSSGRVVYELLVSTGPIISSDTCGIIWRNQIGFVGGDNTVVCFEARSGKVLWRSRVEGFAGRQICSVDENHVYYVTLSGTIGALSISEGSHLWNIKTEDNALVSPISILGSNLIVLADAHLNVLKSQNGQLIQKIPVGHSPYSMVSLNGEYGLLGAGEPPHNGLLFGFHRADNIEKYKCEVQTSNTFIEEKFIDISINISNTDQEIIAAELDGSIFYLEKPLAGEMISPFSFTFRSPIPSSMCPSDYVVLLSLYLASGECLIRPISFRLLRRNPLPNRAYLSSIPDIIQERPQFSGAAIGSTIKSMHGDCEIDQSTFREMVDASRDLGNYEPHDTWRIILRRILTSKAKNKGELPEFKI